MPLLFNAVLRQLEASLSLTLSARLDLRRAEQRAAVVHSAPADLPSRPIPSSLPPRPMLGPGLVKTWPSNVVELSTRRRRSA
jgi:hypothetical protein